MAVRAKGQRAIVRELEAAGIPFRGRARCHQRTVGRILHREPAP
ncbi:MAG: hypothetical protein HQ592_00345 [Planctomycetes bacterium]|nr:hypothetical protein [Planctomycetota bacterium]